MSYCIFSGSGLRTTFANIIYRCLMTRKPVSYEMVYKEFNPRDDDYYKSRTISNEDGYGELKKAFSLVIKALKVKDSTCIVDNGKRGKGKTFSYVGVSEDPLAEERKAVVQKTLQDYVTFCKESSGLLPMGWFSHFFENTQILLDMSNDEKDGKVHIRSSLEQELRHIDWLPLLNKFIMDKHVLNFVYHPYGKEPVAVIMHPHFLKEHNGRWFLFGRIDKNEEFKVTNFALDRIVTEPQIVEGITYQAAKPGLYRNYFKDIIGVTHENTENKGVQSVVIRTKTLYQHELLVSKKLHHSQKETKPFAKYKDGCYGEVTLQIEVNRELRGRILMYGETLEVMKPASLRAQIAKTVNEMHTIYR